MWDDTPFDNGPISTSSNPTNPSANPHKPSTKPPVLPLNQGEDYDMWDLVDELQVQAKSSVDVNLTEGPPAPVDDDDWDSMYA